MHAGMPFIEGNPSLRGHMYMTPVAQRDGEVAADQTCYLWSTDHCFFPIHGCGHGGHGVHGGDLGVLGRVNLSHGGGHGVHGVHGVHGGDRGVLGRVHPGIFGRITAVAAVAAAGLGLSGTQAEGESALPVSGVTTRRRASGRPCLACWPDPAGAPKARSKFQVRMWRRAVPVSADRVPASRAPIASWIPVDARHCGLRIVIGRSGPTYYRRLRDGWIRL